MVCRVRVRGRCQAHVLVTCRHWICHKRPATSLSTTTPPSDEIFFFFSFSFFLSFPAPRAVIVFGQGWRACRPSSASPPCGSLRVVRLECEAYMSGGKRGRALPGTTAIPTLGAYGPSGRQRGGLWLRPGKQLNVAILCTCVEELGACS